MNNGRKGRLRPPRTCTLVVKVDSYQPDEATEGCYPGSFRATISGGRYDREQVLVSVLETPTNANTRKVADLAGEGNISHTLPGGYVALSGAFFSGQRVYASWASRFAGPDDELRIGLPIQISPALDAEGNPRRYRSNSATVYNVKVLHLPETATVASHGELFRAVSDCFTADRAAMIAYTDRTDGDTKRTTRVVWRGWRDGSPIPLDEAVLKVFAEPFHSRLEEAIQRCGQLDVVPIEPLRVGPLTAESIDQGRRSHVMLDAYSCGGLGGRIATALQQVGGDKAEAVNRAFLAGLFPNKKDSFGRDGWRSMWNSDIQRFFNGLGCQLPMVPRMGYAVSTALLKPYNLGQDGKRQYFLARSKALGYAVPRDAVVTPTDPDVDRRFYNEFRTIVEDAANRIMHGPADERNADEENALQNERRLLEDGPQSVPRTATHPIEPFLDNQDETVPGM